MSWREYLLIFIIVAASLGLFALSFKARAQGPPSGKRGDGHMKLHGDFYHGLQRPDGGGSCCNDTDCRPTQSRANGDRYEVIIDGEWVPVPPEKILKRKSPDGEAHVCAANKTTIYCVVLPPEA